MADYRALIPAAGISRRFGGALKKQFADLGGQSVLRRAANHFLSLEKIIAVHIVAAENPPNFIRAEFAQWSKSRFHICGGQTRAQSVANGLAESAADDDDWILIHDAARPCLSADSLDRLMDEVGDDSVGGILALPLADALKITDENRIIKSESRDKKYLAQTPQMFRAAILRDALAKLPNADDESAAVESLGLQPKIVLGESRNIKITSHGDLAIAQAIIAADELKTEKPESKK